MDLCTHVPQQYRSLTLSSPAFSRTERFYFETWPPPARIREKNNDLCLDADGSNGDGGNVYWHACGVKKEAARLPQPRHRQMRSSTGGSERSQSRAMGRRAKGVCQGKRVSRVLEPAARFSSGPHATAATTKSGSSTRPATRPAPARATASTSFRTITTARVRAACPTWPHSSWDRPSLPG